MKHLSLLIIAIFAALVLSIPAKAGPVGHLDTGICGGGGVTITATVIDFLLPVGGGNGCTMTGNSTNVAYTGGGPLGRTYKVRLETSQRVCPPQSLTS